MTMLLILGAALVLVAIYLVGRGPRRRRAAAA